MEGGDDNKESNDNCNANSYIEFPWRHFQYSQKQRRTDLKTNFNQQNLHPFNMKQSSNNITPLHRRNQQTTDYDSNDLQPTEDESDDH